MAYLSAPILIVVIICTGCSTHEDVGIRESTLPQLSGLRLSKDRASGEINSVILDDAQIDQNVIDLLGHVSAFEIVFKHCHLGNSVDWSSVAHNEKINRLTFKEMEVSVLLNLGTSTSLGALNFYECTAVGGTFPEIRRLQSLRDLGLDGCLDVSPAEFRELTGSHISLLSINDISLGDEILPTLRTMTNLKTVSCAYTDVSDDAVFEMRRDFSVDLQK